jgi:TatD DNase family protein
MKFLDIHTHHQQAGKNAIKNILQYFKQIPTTGFYTAGLHPWYLTEEKAEADLEELKSVCKNNNILAIGECGLDKACKTNFDFQQNYFAKQIQLANEIGKPLIIHCVKAYAEVLQILKENKVSVPVIFHGFNKNAQRAEQIINQGHFLSFGKYLLEDRGQEVFKLLPLDKIFLETDEAPIEIEAIYRSAALAKQMDLEILKQQIEKNAKLVFSKNFIEHDE